MADHPNHGTSPELLSASLSPPENEDEIGRLGRFRILKLIGQGAMGMVFHAEDTGTSEPVALKLIQPSLVKDAAHRQRFDREAALTRELDHPHVIRILEVGEEKGVPYLVMPLLQGETLEAQLLREGHLPTEEVLRIGRQLADGLAYAHDRGLTHRDIKPSNVWLEGAAADVRILDFGLAKPVESETQLTVTAATTGTPFYMAPEVAELGQADHRSDLFSLGCVLYRMSTGRLPFEGEHWMALLLALTEDDPTPPREVRPEIPDALSGLIMGLLSKPPDARPQPASYVRDLLGRYEQEPDAPAETITYVPRKAETISREPSTAPRRHRNVRRGQRWGVLLTLLTALLIALGAARGYWWGDSSSEGGDAGRAEEPGPADLEDPSIPVAPAASIDLLEFIDTERDRVDRRSGPWTMRDGTLESPPTNLAMIEIPYEPPFEYDLEAVIERKWGQDYFVTRLATPGSAFDVYLDAWPSRGWEATIRTEPVEMAQSTPHKGQVLIPERTRKLLFRVRRSSVTVLVDGQEIIHREGDPDTLSSSWRYHHPRALGFRTHSGVFQVHKLTLMSVSGEGKRLR